LLQRRVFTHGSNFFLVRILLRNYLFNNWSCFNTSRIVKEVGKAVTNVNENKVRYRHVLKWVFFPLLTTPSQILTRMDIPYAWKN
jgi:hypothetical protein